MSSSFPVALVRVAGAARQYLYTDGHSPDAYDYGPPPGGRHDLAPGGRHDPAPGGRHNPPPADDYADAEDYFTGAPPGDYGDNDGSYTADAPPGDYSNNGDYSADAGVGDYSDDNGDYIDTSPVPPAC